MNTSTAKPNLTGSQRLITNGIFFSCKIEVFIVMIGSNIFEILMKWELPVYHQMKLFVSDLKTIANLFL